MLQVCDQYIQHVIVTVESTEQCEAKVNNLNAILPVFKMLSFRLRSTKTSLNESMAFVFK